VSFRYSLLIALVQAAASAGAQVVGYPPGHSPYLDLEYSQELTPILGYYWGRVDPAAVAPGNGGLVGLHYEWRAGGPAHLYGEVAHIGSSRTVLDPAKPTSTRDLGERSWPIWSADAGLGMSLTGARSWHNVVPMVKAGVGLMSDFKSADVGGFKYGTRFALTWGAALRYVPAGSRYQIRADFSNRLTSIRYPDVYFRPLVAGVTPILSGKDQSVWRNNPALTIGISYLFSR
jgi:hypothetical protein